MRAMFVSLAAVIILTTGTLCFVFAKDLVLQETQQVTASAELIECREHLGTEELATAAAEAALTECTSQIHYSEASNGNP